MKRWNYMIKHALMMYAEKDKYVYLYGANGEKGSDTLVERLWSQYPDHFRTYVTNMGYTKKHLKDHVRGKICLDCSSFICYISQQEEFKDLRVVKDYNSTMLRDAFMVKRTPVEGTAGSVLYKPGHVALDIGYGMYLEFASEFTDMRLREISKGTFTESGELCYIDYTGTNNR